MSSLNCREGNLAHRLLNEYEVQLYGAEKTVELPFGMGAFADVVCNPVKELPPVADRMLREFSVDNFDDRLKAIEPKVQLEVPNTLTNEGNMKVEMSFESMADFEPGAVARKVEPLRQLLEARMQLANLLTYMDGKSGAEELLDKILHDPGLMKSLAASRKPESDSEQKPETSE